MVSGARPTAQQRRQVFAFDKDGFNQKTIALKTGLDARTVKAILAGLERDNGDAYLKRASGEEDLPEPKQLPDIDPDALAALDDRSGFLFCKRYMGIELSKFQQMMWESLEDLWESPDREFACVNAPPGLGKSTVYVGFAAKRIARNRAVRFLFISRAHSLAERNVRRLRRLLERTSPAVGGSGTLAQDFGRFKPSDAGEVWRAAEGVVEQLDGTPVEEKEPTFAAFGFDSDWIGNRIDGLLGDDLDSTRSMSNVETVERNRDIFDNELEPRVDPPRLEPNGVYGGGLMCIAQQRLGVWDFSNHALSKQIPAEEDDGLAEDVATIPQYRHLVWKAHYEDRCRGAETHVTGAPAWPDGCLLDPRRLSWRDLRKAMNNTRRFQVVYQQEESDASSGLVQKVWIDGGRDASGEVFPGCWDKDRGLCEIPKGLVEPNLSVVSCDPSPTRFWAIEWWLVNTPTEQRLLLDLHRGLMDAPDFLDWNMNDGCYSGLLEEWWQRSADLGAPFTVLIVESNAAQRFMLQYDLFVKWASRRKVRVIPHQTHRNKSDPEFGLQSIASRYRFGQVRLPGKDGDPGRMASLKLIHEATHYPDVSTDDCLMAQWFLEWNLPHLAHERHDHAPQPRPSWVLA